MTLIEIYTASLNLSTALIHIEISQYLKQSWFDLKSGADCD